MTPQQQAQHAAQYGPPPAGWGWAREQGSTLTQTAPPTVLRGDRNGLGTAALVLGILALLFCWIPIVGVISWPLAIIGVILGLVGANRARNRQASNRGTAIAGIVTSAVALAVCILWVMAFGSAASATRAAAPSASTASQPAASAPAAAPAQSAAPLQPAAPAAPSGPVATVGDGTYQVGVDIAAGRYKTPGPDKSDDFPSCYWKRSKDDSGDFRSIISNDNISGPGSVTVKKGEFVTFNGGCTWTKQ